MPDVHHRSVRNPLDAELEMRGGVLMQFPELKIRVGSYTQRQVACRQRRGSISFISLACARVRVGTHFIFRIFRVSSFILCFGLGDGGRAGGNKAGVWSSEGRYASWTRSMATTS